MKTVFTTITLLLSVFIFAQTPIIKDIRTIVADQPNDFMNLRKDLLKDNTATTGTKEYSSTIEDLSINRNLIITGPQGTQYLMIYNTDRMSDDAKNFFALILKQYFAEIEEMGTSGKYVVRHYKSNSGVLISEVKDTSGQKILEYRINGSEHLILFVGPKK